MNTKRRAKPSAAALLDEGGQSFLAGRFYLAAEAYAKAMAIEPKNPVILFNLASAKERTGEIGEAAKLLTEALRLRPSWFEAAQRLAHICGKYVVEDAGLLDPHGLLAAFAFERIDRQAIAAAALAHLRAATALGAALAQADVDEAARALVVKRTDKLLAHPLLLAALAAGPNRDIRMERLLTALRRALLVDLPPARFEDKALAAFALALAHQCLHNEHVFAVSAEETRRLAALPVDWAALRQGSAEDSRRLILHLLYTAPIALAAGHLTEADYHALRPRALGELIGGILAEEARQTALANEIPALSGVADETSRRVARQYEAHPYPRWTSLQMPAEGSAARRLRRLFPAERLGFLDGPFKVLIAGAGTGQHAIAAAVRYGPKADVVAIDLSRRSLAYARSKAAALGVANVHFAQADILELAEDDGPFDCIEAVGVLHHMAEPFKGWQSLLRLLRPGGIMLAGLYSAAARRNIAALRSEAGYPGAGCDDAAARDYRAALMAREDGAAGLASSHDFYTLSEFRDLALHEHERPVFLSEIEAFLSQNGLKFRGFNLPAPIIAIFLKTFPGDPWPGSLANWAAFEEQRPRTFEAMYQLWCEKAG